MTDDADLVKSATTWTPWEVVPDSGFEVAGAEGRVGLRQITESDFVVDGDFRFSDTVIEQDLVDTLVGDEGATPEQARRLVDDARCVRESGQRTNLASVPQFMQWFERPYGRHTLAALIHDELIVDQPNRGVLGSDTASDRFFRLMLGASGVPLLKRWIMWAAVALRSRWAAGGRRRLSLIVWAVLAVAGFGLFSWGVVVTIRAGDVPTPAWWSFAGAAVLIAVSGLLRTATGGVGMAVAIVGAGLFMAGLVWSVAAGAVPGSAWALLVGAGVALPIVSSVLWGRQWGASFVAALAGVFVIPAGVFVVLGLGIYWLFEDLGRAFGRN